MEDKIHPDRPLPTPPSTGVSPQTLRILLKQWKRNGFFKRQKENCGQREKRTGQVKVK